MSLRGQPAYDPRELRTVIPLEDVSVPGEGGNADWQPMEGYENGIRVISRKNTRQQAYFEGQPRTTISYNLYADHRRGTRFFLTENNRIWHPDDSYLYDNGEINPNTAFDITSVVAHDTEGVAQIDCSRETGS